MDQDGIGARLDIPLGPVDGRRGIEAHDQRLGAGHHHKIGIRLGVLARAQLARELFHRSQNLALRAQKGVGLRKDLVLDANPPDPAQAQLANQLLKMTELPVARITVEKNRDLGARRNGLKHIEHFGHGEFAVVTKTRRARKGQRTRPQPGDSGLLDDGRRERIVRLQNLLDPGAFQQPAKFL